MNARCDVRAFCPRTHEAEASGSLGLCEPGLHFFNAKNGVMSLISTLRMQREVDLCDIETRLV